MQTLGERLNRRGKPIGVVATTALSVACAAGSALAVAQTAVAQTAGAPVYRCPGNPVLYTDALTAREAKDKGCRTVEGSPITIVPAFHPRAPVAGGNGQSASGERVEPADQRLRDTEARRILEDELRKAQDRLAAVQAEYNNGQPERRGDERNYQKYLDRVQELKTDIARKEGDVAALKRELGKLPS